MESDKQTNNTIEKPWLWKKGQSGNPKGRPKGMTMKEYARNYLACMTDEERNDFLDGLGKDTIWEMAEGRPEAKSEIKVTEDIKVDDKQINAIRTALGLTDKATDSTGS